MTRRQFGNVRKLASARWQATYWHDGRRHNAPSTFKTKTGAARWLSTVETDIGRGGWIDPAGGRMTVDQLAARWLESNPSKRKSTRVRDEAIIRLHILPTLGTWRLASVTPPVISNLVRSWSAAGQAPKTVTRQYAVVRAIFAYAEASDWIVRTPCRTVKLPTAVTTKRHGLTSDEVAAIAQEVGVRYAPMVWIGAASGLRWAEVAGLTVGSFDMIRRTQSVVHQLDRDGTLSPPKSAAGSRTQTLPRPLIDMLAVHMAAMGVDAKDADQLLFTAQRGGRLSYTNWRRRVWLPAVERAGVPGVGFHDLRRANATQLVVSGVDMKTAQTRLGHASPQLTLALYAQATSEGDEGAADRMGERFFGTSRT